MNESMAISGSVCQVQIKCEETPFFQNLDGHICYRTSDNIVCLVNFDGISPRSAIAVMTAMNWAYKTGYEKDRIQWV